MNDPLAARFESLLVPAPAPDWLEVRRRARRSRRPLALAAVAVALFVAVPAVAIAVRSGVLPWGEADPAPSAVVERFAAHDRAVKEFTARRSAHPLDLEIVAGEARAFHLGDGTTAYVAPTRSGGYYAFLESPRDPLGAVDYRLGVNPSRPAIASGWHGSAASGNYVNGHVVAAPGSSVEIVLDDGSTLHAPVTWIGPPIETGIFYASLGPDRYAEAVVLRGPDGRELARDGHLGTGHRELEKLKKRMQDGGTPPTGNSDSPQPGGAAIPG